ncbi:MAG: protease HtpX [Succinivibrio sp.]|nr:protease HtpX [Succinivibrio sp.]
MRRGLVYLATMVGIIVVIGIVSNIICALLGVDPGSGGIGSILLISAVMGFAGSLISLFMSKSMVKRSMGVRVIGAPQTQDEQFLVNTISMLAQKKGVQMPEVGIYDAQEMNAFATGWNRNQALVAVSSGLLRQMNQEEVSAVLGHEMSHVANGDMVTMSLVQGIVNTFVYALSYLAAAALASRDRNSRGGSVMMQYAVRSVLQMCLGFLGTMVVMWFSRLREYRADAGSAEVLGNAAMIRALQALKQQSASTQKPATVQALCIFGVSSASELFMSHPPLDKRIAALSSHQN